MFSLFYFIYLIYLCFFKKVVDLFGFMFQRFVDVSSCLADVNFV